MYTTKGTLKLANQTQVISEKFSKRSFVITTVSGKYPQDIEFQLTQDKCSLLDGIQLGSELEIHWNLNGREWTSPAGEVKYFNTVEAWRIDKAGDSKPAIAKESTPALPPNNKPINEEADDLPF